MITFDFTFLQPYIQLSIAQQQDIQSFMHHKTLPKDSILLLDPEDLIIADSGILMKIQDDKDDVAHFIAPYELAIYPNKDDHYKLQALEVSSIYYIRHHDVMTLLHRHSTLSTAYHKMLRVWSMRRMIRGELLLLSRAEAKSHFYKKFNSIAARIPYKYIASYLNMTPSYFSQL